MSWGKRTDLVVHADDPFNAEPPRDALADERITSLDAFYVRNHGPVPELEPSAWRLRVDGLVERELELSLAELRSRFARHEVAATLQCAGNRRAGFLTVRDIPGEAPWGPGATGTAVWSGVRLTDVLTAAGIHANAEHVAFLGADVSEEPLPTAGVRRLAFAPQGDRRRGAARLEHERRAASPRARGARPAHRPRLRRGPQRQVARANNRAGRALGQLLPGRELPSAAGRGGPGCDRPGRRRRPRRGRRQRRHPLTRRGRDGCAGAAAGLGICVRRRRSPHRSRRRLDRRGADLAPGRPGRRAESVDLGRWETEVDVAAPTTEIVARAWDSAAAAQPESAAHLWNPKGYVNNAWARVTVSADRPAAGGARTTSPGRRGRA